jgi:putative two-component system response regulator
MKNINKCKILVVDDIKTNLDVLIQTLGDEYVLAVAMNGKKAMNYAVNNFPDLILLDIMMPEMDGFEVCRKLKENPTTCDIPIIFITAVNASSEKTKGFKLGAVDYITKPFDTVEVKARVKTHLNLKLHQEALKNHNIILEEKVKERTKELVETKIEILERLGLAAEHRDLETGQHIKRMSEYCRLLGKSIGLPAVEYNNIALASTMHDLGKIGIPDSILSKPGKLTEKEMATMKTHPEIGAKILSGSKSKLLKVAETICLSHHERWNGTGYPRGLKKEKIPLVGRIACICDVFDALISQRPYKTAWPIEKALDEIRSGSGSFFDPQLVTLFMEMETDLRGIVRALGSL